MRVLIADDENMICEWMQFCISQNPDCQLVGVAHNGREALELFEQRGADLVLSDIKMPVMDGLELLDALRQRSGQVQVVMLTAFSDFELARQALRKGAAEYILKTEMRNELLQDLLERFAQQGQSAASSEPQSLALSSQDHSIVSRLMRKREELKEEEIGRLKKSGLRWRDNGLFVLSVWKRELLYGGLRFPEVEYAQHIVGFDDTERIYAVVIDLPRAASSTEKSRQLTQYAKEVQALNGCMVGVSAVTDRMQQVPLLVRQAASSLAQGFYREDPTLYEPHYSLMELSSQTELWEKELADDKLRLYQIEGEKRSKWAQEFLDRIKHKPILMLEPVCKLCLELFDLLLMDLEKSGQSLPGQEAKRLQLAQSVSLREISEILMEMAALLDAKQKPARQLSKSVSLAAEYIREHYADPLSLEQVADRVYLNSEYFSRIFKEEMGQNFVNFLTDVRLRHSIELLETTAMRVQNIAQAVGYSNVSYFSTTFKRKYGVSPYEYRRQKG